jgi:hypothetical protein
VRICANKVVACVRLSTLLPTIRLQDTRQFTSAQQINQLEGLAVAIPWGFESPLPHFTRSRSFNAAGRRPSLDRRRCAPRSSAVSNLGMVCRPPEHHQAPFVLRRNLSGLRHGTKCAVRRFRGPLGAPHSRHMSRGGRSSRASALRRERPHAPRSASVTCNLARVIFATSCDSGTLSP